MSGVSSDSDLTGEGRVARLGTYDGEPVAHIEQDVTLVVPRARQSTAGEPQSSFAGVGLQLTVSVNEPVVEENGPIIRRYSWLGLATQATLDWNGPLP